MGCKWKARAKRNAAGNWVLTMMHDKHNGHAPSSNATAHPSLRQLGPEAVEVARQAFNDKKSPKQVLELLQQQFNPDVTAQDVYNLKAKINRSDSAKSTPAKQLTQRTEPEIPTDPALQMQGMTMLEEISCSRQADGPIDPSAGLNGNPSGEAGAHKCACKCCDH